MEPVNYTTPFSAGSGIHDARSPGLDLILPDGETFRSLPPRVSMPEMMRRIRELRQWFPEGLRRPEERWAAKSDVEFRL